MTNVHYNFRVPQHQRLSRMLCVTVVLCIIPAVAHAAFEKDITLGLMTDLMPINVFDMVKAYIVASEQPDEKDIKYIHDLVKYPLNITDHEVSLVRLLEQKYNHPLYTGFSHFITTADTQHLTQTKRTLLQRFFSQLAVGYFPEQQPFTPILLQLIRAKASIARIGGQPLLFYAMRYLRSPEIIEALLDNKADPSTRHRSFLGEGNALSLTLEDPGFIMDDNGIKIIKMLLEAKASPIAPFTCYNRQTSPLQLITEKIPRLAGSHDARTKVRKRRLQIVHELFTRYAIPR